MVYSEKVVLERAIKLRDSLSSRTNCNGLCATLNPYKNLRIRNLLQGIFSKWPEFSGNYGFPISTNKKIKPSSQYKKYYLTGKLYSNTPYGNARKRLLGFVISELERREK